MHSYACAFLFGNTKAFPWIGAHALVLGIWGNGNTQCQLFIIGAICTHVIHQLLSLMCVGLQRTTWCSRNTVGASIYGNTTLVKSHAYWKVSHVKIKHTLVRFNILRCYSQGRLVKLRYQCYTHIRLTVGHLIQFYFININFGLCNEMPI